MGPILKRRATPAAAGLLAALAAPAIAQEPAFADRHQLQLELHAAFTAPSSALGGWPDGGLGKLRFDERGDHLDVARLLAVYRGRLARTVWATVVADYVNDASGGLDLTEAFLEIRPVPRSAAEQRIRVGAFYPPLSLENGERGWESPFTQSFSAINTWLGEEVRPVGAEWSLRRRLGLGSPQELRVSAAAFFGNDPAGTLLFWRGWALHDRQTRLNDRLPIPPMPLFANGTVAGLLPQTVEPLAEIDGKPGAYAAVEWRYGRRALVQLARYDNRADPTAFASAQWGWDTMFDHLGVQIALPHEWGLVAQRLQGRTAWLIGARPDGTLAPIAALVDDRFAARFVMLTRMFRGAHRLALRYDDFRIGRNEPQPALQADDGHAWTLGYRYARSERLALGLEWLEVESRRDLWTEFYGRPHRATESEWRLAVELRLDTRR